MSITGARLAVEVGAARIKALVAWPDGVVQVVTFDGRPWLSAEVAVTADGSVLVGASAQQRAVDSPAALVAPVPALTGPPLVVSGREVEPAALVTALVREVADQVDLVADGIPAQVVAAVPAAWGPQRRQALREALSHGGLGQVELVATPVAVAQFLLASGATMPAGAGLLVCNMGVWFEACMLRYTGTDFEVISTIVDKHAGGTALDDAVAAALGLTVSPPGGDGAVVATSEVTGARRAARTTREALSFATSVPVQPHGPGPAGTFTVAQLKQVSAPVMAAAAFAARQAVDAADLPAGTVLWVVTAGGGARMPVIADPLEEALGIRPWMVADPDLAVVYGALHTAPGTGPAAVQDTVDPDSVGSWLDIATFVGAAVAAVALYAQFVVGAGYTGPGVGMSPQWGGLAAACTMAVLACVVGAVLITAGRYADNRDLRQRIMAMSLGGGGVVGLVVSAVAGFSAASGFGVAAGPFLDWSMLPVLPITVAAAGTGAVMLWRRDTPPGGWLAWLRFPAAAILLVGLGELFIGYDLTATPSLLDPLGHLLQDLAPENGLKPISAIGRVGALATGAGIGLLLVRRWWLQIPVSVVLGVMLAATLSSTGTGTIAVGFAVATAGWWLWRGIYLVLRPIVLPDPTSGSTRRPPAADGAGREHDPLPASIPSGGDE